MLLRSPWQLRRPRRKRLVGTSRGLIEIVEPQNPPSSWTPPQMGLGSEPPVRRHADGSHCHHCPEDS